MHGVIVEGSVLAGGYQSLPGGVRIAISQGAVNPTVRNIVKGARIVLAKRIDHFMDGASVALPHHIEISAKNPCLNIIWIDLQRAVGESFHFRVTSQRPVGTGNLL